MVQKPLYPKKTAFLGPLLTIDSPQLSKMYDVCLTPMDRKGDHSTTPPSRSDTLHGFWGAETLNGHGVDNNLYAPLPGRMYRKNEGAEKLGSAETEEVIRPPINWHRSEVNNSDNAETSSNSDTDESAGQESEDLCIGVVELPVASVEAFYPNWPVESTEPNCQVNAIHYPNPNASEDGLRRLEHRIANGTREKHSITSDNTEDSISSENNEEIKTIYPIFITSSRKHISHRNKRTEDPEEGGERWFIAAADLSLKHRNQNGNKPSVSAPIPKKLEPGHNSYAHPNRPDRIQEIIEKRRDNPEKRTPIPEEARLPEFDINQEGERSDDITFIYCLYWIKKNDDWEPVILMYNYKQFIQLPDRAFYNLFPTDVHYTWTNDIGHNLGDLYGDAYFKLETQLMNLNY